MKLQQTKPLSNIYKREEAFSAALAKNLGALDIGSFEDAETESTVGTRRADIVATGESGILVIENQFGKADWDHWGRLEAYARLKKATVAALVAEDFEELMIVTCNLRNEDSNIDWYLIKAEANSHGEVSFHHVVQPAIDIQTERAGIEYSLFWEPIRKEGLFAGKPVPKRDEGWISKGIKGISLQLALRDNTCFVKLEFPGDDRQDRRAKVVELFPESEFTYQLHESPKFAFIKFPVLEKGKKAQEHWPEIREKLTTMGGIIYDKINESDF